MIKSEVKKKSEPPPANSETSGDNLGGNWRFLTSLFSKPVADLHSKILDVSPPLSVPLSSFHAVSAKLGQIIGWRTPPHPPGKYLDPPLQAASALHHRYTGQIKVKVRTTLSSCFPFISSLIYDKI